MKGCYPEMQSNSTKIVTPSNAHEMSLDEAVKYCLMEGPAFPPMAFRRQLLEAMYTVLGYELTGDGLIMLLSEVKYKLVTAVAGGGKTTTTNLAIILFKVLEGIRTKSLVPGYRVLYLVFNKHNSFPMKASHANMIATLKKGGIKNLNIDSELAARTVHAFSRMWISEYPEETGYKEEGFLSDLEMKGIFRQCAGLLQIPEEYPINMEELKSGRSYLINAMLPLDGPEAAARAKLCNLSSEQFSMICMMYEKFKENLGRFDYLDMVFKLIKLLESNPIAADRIRSNYSLVVYDEGQDLTRLMVKLIRLLVGETVPVMAVGDPDQTIYGFNGADHRTLSQFDKIFEGGKVFTLSKNRRCSAAVVECAMTVLALINDRNHIDIIPARKGGSVELIGYGSEEGQIQMIVESLKIMPVEELSETAIIYRNQAQESMIVGELDKAGIVYSLKGTDIYEELIFQNMFSILNCLMYPYVSEHQLHMYKVLPKMKKLGMEQLLGYDNRSGRFSKAAKAFPTLDFGLFETDKKFAAQKKYLSSISQVIDVTPLNAYFKRLFEMYLENYWDAYSHLQKVANNDYLKERLFEYFNVDKTFPDLFKEYSERKIRVDRANKMGEGITIGTFHSVKGREFNQVFITYMDDSIMPSRSTDELDNSLDIEAILSGNSTEGFIPDSETRLFHVAVTRAKYSNFIYYNIHNPSAYAKVLLDYYANKELMQEVATTQEVLEIEPLQVSEEFTLNIANNDEAVVNPVVTNKNTLMRLFGGK
jgi:DNA helicase-2/ATP-dependent DNA helicase PcrA